MKYHILLLTALCFTACHTPSNDPLALVDPFVGTGFHGHTYPGATTPFGMVQLSPDTRANNWDACAGYHYSDTTLNGFSHTHLSGTGCADLGDILVYPTWRNDAIYQAETPLKPYRFSHQQEQASCGYYQVELLDAGIAAELTASTHVGVHRYTFHGTGTPQIVIDLRHTISDEVVDSLDLRQIGDSELVGMRRTQGWVTNHALFFAARFSQTPTAIELLKQDRAIVTFADTTRTIVLAVGLSATGTEQAQANALAEVPQLDFEQVRGAAEATWRKTLGRIRIEGGTPEARTNFYTALYHATLSPNTMSDVDGSYRRHDSTITTLAEGSTYYSTLSLWDTFRAWYPLQMLLDTSLVSNTIQSMLDMYDCTGELPIWPLASGETGTMIGYHAAPVIADAYINGIRDFDAEKALEAMIRSSNNNKKGSDYYTRLGYIPSNIKRESVSCALEYAYDDWTIARMAEAMGRDGIRQEYDRRALNYISVFDGSTCFFRGRNSDGSWSKPFEEFATGRDYTEATPWQYRFFVPHDVYGLEQLFGSKAHFAEELDRLFTLESDAMQLDVEDVTGLVGQYAHGNEPSHHMAYLYNYIGMPWKTQAMTRQLLDQMYAPTPEGIIGNEDCGQMSAWYILSSLGLYAVCPASGEFSLTTPQFERAEIDLASGQTLTIVANNPRKNQYIQSVTFNGEPVTANYINYKQLMQGGELRFELGSKPNLSRGITEQDAPYSLTQHARVSLPYTTQSLSLFTEPVAVELHSTTPDAVIYYTLDGSRPDTTATRYTAPFEVNRSLTLRACAYKEGLAPSAEFTIQAEQAQFRKPISAAPTQQGTRYRYFEGYFSKVSDLRPTKLVASGSLPTPSIASARQTDHFGYIFEGLIRIPKRGVWEFMTKSDDGSVLYIDSQRVVDNDGSHASVMATGRIALEAGLYPYELLYFEDYEGEDLSWGWKAPGATTFTAIPAENLYIR